MPQQDNVLQPPPAEIGDGKGDAPPPPPPAADPVKDLETRFLAELKKRDDEIDKLRRTPAAQEPPKPSADPYTEGMDAEFFTAPHKVLKRVRDDAVREAEERLTKQYQQDQQVTLFWNNFYRSNSQFDRGKDHALIETIARANINQFAGKSGEQQAEILAKQANDMLLDFTKRHGPSKSSDSSLTIEPASPTHKSKTDVAREPVILTFAQTLKKRQQARAEAMSKRISKESA